MALVFLPDRHCFFSWGDERPSPELAGVAARAMPSVELVTPSKKEPVDGASLPLVDSVAALASVPASEISTCSGSVAAWALASKLALNLLSRERVVPTIARQGGHIVARWGAALSLPEDASQLAALARSMPPAAHAVPAPRGGPHDVWAPEALLRAFLDDTIDALVRLHRGDPEAPAARPKTRRKRAADPVPWEARWQTALTAGDGRFDAEGFTERTLIDDLVAWSQPALGARDRLRACFRLELPEADREPFVVRFLLQSPDDPSLLVSAGEVWSTKGRRLAKLGRAFRDPQESLLEALGRAARLFPPIASCLREARPEALALDPAEAWEFASEGARALADAGFGVLMPAELTRTGQRRLRLRMRVSGGTKVAGAVSGAAGLGLDELLSFEWEAALGNDTLSLRQLRALAKHKAPLVRHRGQWVVIDPRELDAIQQQLAKNESGTITARSALVAALTGEARHGKMDVAVRADGVFAELLGRLREGASRPANPPRAFRGTLRPYQARGLAWLRTMGALGLGACLADDMGLGKTVQLLAFLLDAAEDPRPALLVAPTSVLGNWEHEAARFAPGLRVVRHYGPERAREAEQILREPGTVVLTSYGLLRRDAPLLAAIEWSTVALDEAQNIKNPASRTAKAARSLVARRRFALTGTPVENRLAELWSIFEFANPGLLGPLETFRRQVAVPIERYGNEDAAKRLRSMASPFLLRRLKSDPTIIQDLPRKNEMKIVCTLTREQATLYQAVVDEEMRRIESADGIERRGRVLALLTSLKQICNHPTQYLGDAGSLPRRSGKLDRTTEMLDEALAERDRALVFTQFREMGERLVSHLGAQLGVEVASLHGGTPRKARDEMVRRFQDDARGPRVFVLSVKAGGTGLNLTAASHVFHFDRWWNPAVEDQATDRAYRIGQKRSVQVYKLICAGTVEEKIDHMLEKKRGLASKVVRTGEKWITELGDEELRDLFALSASAAIGDDEESEAGGRARGSRARSRRGEAGA